jgi:hypothetical protein
MLVMIFGLNSIIQEVNFGFFTSVVIFSQSSFADWDNNLPISAAPVTHTQWVEVQSELLSSVSDVLEWLEG